MKTLLCTLLVVAALTSRAQTEDRPLQIDWELELGLTLNVGAFAAQGHLLQMALPPLTSVQLQQLDPMDLPRFDRIATTGYRTGAARLSDIVINSSLAIPLVMALHPNMREDYGMITFLTFQTYLLSDGFTAWTKYAVRRPRPFTYLDPSLHPDLPGALKGYDSRLSFFSGHTSGTATATFLAAQLFDTYWPNHKARPFVWLGAALLPALSGYLRVRAGKHYPSDVVAGYVVGASIGLINPWLHRRNRRPN